MDTDYPVLSYCHSLTKLSLSHCLCLSQSVCQSVCLSVCLCLSLSLSVSASESMSVCSPLSFFLPLPLNVCRTHSLCVCVSRARATHQPVCSISCVDLKVRVQQWVDRQ